MEKSRDSKAFEYLVIVLWIIGYSAFYTVSGAPSTYNWYFAAVHASYLLALAIAISKITLINNYKNILITLAIIFAVGIFSSPYILFRKALPGNQAIVEASVWLNNNVKAGEDVATGAVGMLGYYAPSVKFLDMHGLVSKEVFEYRKEKKLIFNTDTDSAKQEAEIVSVFLPAYVITGYPQNFDKYINPLTINNPYIKVKEFKHLTIYRRQNL